MKTIRYNALPKERLYYLIYTQLYITRIRAFPTKMNNEPKIEQGEDYLFSQSAITINTPINAIVETVLRPWKFHIILY